MTAVASRGAMGVVWRFALATTLIVLAFAMTGPVLAISLQRAGASTAAVGLFAMVPFLLIGLLIPVVPRILARWGVVRTYRAGCLLELAGVGLYAATDHWLPWTVGAAVSGIGAAGLWNATEALLAREAPPDQRGRVMGLYQTSLGAALALGPFLPALLGWGERPILWAALALVTGCCAVAVSIPSHAAVEPPPGQAGTWHALRQVPLLALIAFSGGVFEAGLGSISAAHASSLGLDLSSAASVAGAIGVGSFLCQLPAGLAADRFPMRRVFTVAALALLAASAALAFADRGPWLLWAVGVVWGGVGGALYTLTMVEVAHEFAGRATAGGAAAMITGYTAGGTIGPVASGSALQWGGLLGLAALLGALAGATLVAARSVPAD
ncbi:MULTISPECIES: MFS transporter [Ramlibacter]|uniref:MFS transporter n=1 Tax=Ramlibacter pinisoli TaxID=2682844 RepID=A0A6N8J149_9BURK|nr:MULTISPECIES: MFS transporter [Ramlibacter]MBA2962623.1 MFS transporter [Ramlibacter sp. CGMCC 1.13660]MVQ32565.1 MFS transporter [Ramlibacter pinisoli]